MRETKQIHLVEMIIVRLYLEICYKTHFLSSFLNVMFEIYNFYNNKVIYLYISQKGLNIIVVF